MIECLNAGRSATSPVITNCFRYADFCNVLIDTTQKQADSGSSMINDIDEDYIKKDDDLSTSEIAMDEDNVKDLMIRK